MYLPQTTQLFLLQTMKVKDKAKLIRNFQLMKCTLEGLCLLKQIIEAEKKEEIKEKSQKQKIIRSCSVREGNRYRLKNSFFVLTFLEIKENDHQQFFEYTRMTPQVFEILVDLMKPFLEKNALSCFY